MYNPFSLENKNILVTGASSGIGRSIAIECSKLGATILITGRSKERLLETMKSMEGDSHKLIIANLTSTDDINKLTDSLPKLDGVVHNAGDGSNRQLCKYISSSNLEDTISINLFAPINLQKAILQKKLLSNEASVVFINSRATFSPSSGNAVYSASKGGLLAYSKVLALELAPRKIRVNSICPGMVWTDLVLSESSISIETHELNQKSYPLMRYGNPNDIAFLTIYLLSDTSKWMTGSTIDITGGGEGILK
jgi:NAD(P)-dependent dehydrogenase (short-subunit alcohol dehydrogenase family)